MILLKLFSGANFSVLVILYIFAHMNTREYPRDVLCGYVSGTRQKEDPVKDGSHNICNNCTVLSLSL